jgi:hypothetical protein
MCKNVLHQHAKHVVINIAIVRSVAERFALEYAANVQRNVVVHVTLNILPAIMNLLPAKMHRLIILLFMAGTMVIVDIVAIRGVFMLQSEEIVVVNVTMMVVLINSLLSTVVS